MSLDEVKDVVSEVKHVVVDNDVVRTTLSVAGAVVPGIPLVLEGLHVLFPSKPDTDKKAPELASTKKRAELGDVPLEGLSLQNTVQVKTFQDALAKMENASDTLASKPGIVDGWNDIAKGINDAMNRITAALSGAENNSEFQGKTKDAIIANFRNSLVEPRTMGKIAAYMSTLAQDFENTVKFAVENISDQKDKYELAKKPPTNESDLQAWDQLAQNVMQGFGKNLAEIGSSNPNFNYVNPSNVRPPQANTPGSNTPGGGKSSSPSGSGKPTTPSPTVRTPTTPNKTTNKPTNTPQSFDPSSLASQLASAANDAGKSATDAAKSALGQLGDAASQALGSLGNSGDQPGLPEGVLGLGPSKASSAASRLGTSKTGGSGSSGGSRSAPRATTSVPAASASKTTGASAASRAGLGATSGSPAGGGAPSAGQRGAGSDKEHKTSKALRNRKQGEDLIGSSEAIVAVLGENPSAARSSAPDSA